MIAGTHGRLPPRPGPTLDGLWAELERLERPLGYTSDDMQAATSALMLEIARLTAENEQLRQRVQELEAGRPSRAEERP